MLLVEQCSNQCHTLSYNSMVEVLDTDDLVVEEINQIDLGSAIRHGFDIYNASLVGNVIKIDTIKSHIFTTSDIFCVWSSKCVEMALGRDAYIKIKIGTFDVHINGKSFCQYIDCIGFPHRYERNGEIFVNIYSSRRLQCNIPVKDYAIYEKGIGAKFKKEYLLRGTIE